MEHKAFDFAVKEISGRSVTGVSSVFGNLDGGRDIIHRGAFRKTLKENLRRVRHLWQHDFSQPPIAAIKEVKEIGREDLPKDILKLFPESTGGLEVTREYLETDRGNEVLAGLRSGAISEMSIGYDPIKFDFEEKVVGTGKSIVIRNLRELRLWDTSDVNWGMNPATSAIKNYIPFQDTGLVEEADLTQVSLKDFTDLPWDKLGEGEKQRIAGHFAWCETSPPQKFEDLKYLHHLPSKDGIGPAAKNIITASVPHLSYDEEIGTLDILGEIWEHFKQHTEVIDFKWIEAAWEIHQIVRKSPNLSWYHPKMESDLNYLLAGVTAAKPVEVNPLLTELTLRKLQMAQFELDKF